MLFLISYDLKSPGRDYTSLYNHIKSLGEWWHYLESTWIVKMPYATDITQISTSIRQMMDSNDCLLVIDITGKDRNGWLPKDAWEWITNND